MSKKFLLSLVVTILFLSSSSRPVIATIWEDMEPQEVVDQADIIIMGNYDFSTEPIASENTIPFCGIPFHVEKVYRGDVSDHVTAGIDCYDMHLIEEFQQDGGKLLLFLESGGETRYDTPVGGSNGLVKLKNGEVLDQDEERKVFFTEFLEDQNETGNPFIYIIVSLIAGLVIAVIVYRKRRSKRYD